MVDAIRIYKYVYIYSYQFLPYSRLTMCTPLLCVRAMRSLRKFTLYPPYLFLVNQTFSIPSPFVINVS